MELYVNVLIYVSNNFNWDLILCGMMTNSTSSGFATYYGSLECNDK